MRPVFLRALVLFSFVLFSFSISCSRFSRFEIISCAGKEDISAHIKFRSARGLEFSKEIFHCKEVVQFFYIPFNKEDWELELELNGIKTVKKISRTELQQLHDKYGSKAIPISFIQ